MCIRLNNTKINHDNFFKSRERIFISPRKIEKTPAGIFLLGSEMFLSLLSFVFNLQDRMGKFCIVQVYIFIAYNLER